MLAVKPLVGLLAVIALATVPVFAQEPKELLRGAELVDGPDVASKTEIKYRKKWAVVVGIDYLPDDCEEARKQHISTLNHAQSDANSVQALLTEKFGFDPNDTTLLIGKKATQTEILKCIGKLEIAGEVTEEDCVLVYFSGHGVLQRVSADNSQRGYLLPVDVTWTNDRVNPGSAINMNVVVEGLKNCPARHKLLLFDCCHSGAVFRLDQGNSAGGSDSRQIGLDTFRPSGFQAITASRDNQKASDGRNGHSPFTNALLEGLQSLPLDRNISYGNPNFTATQLFDKMSHYLIQENQSPQCRWLSQEQGQFHFLPDSSDKFAKFRDKTLDAESRKRLLALTPTTFGNWWALEVPWFMPGLRQAILIQQTSTRSTDDELDRRSLEDAAKQALKEAGSHSKEMTPLYTLRYLHLNLLLAANSPESQRLAIENVVRDLSLLAQPKLKLESTDSKTVAASKTAIDQWQSLVSALKSDGSPNPPETLAKFPELEAEDLHYLAVLYQIKSDSDQAAKYYELALNKYSSNNSLRALCLLDASMLSASQNKWTVAESQLQQAIQAAGNNTPRPFQIFARCRLADTFRRQGRFGLSRANMEIAVDCVNRSDSEQTSLLSANTRKARAWAFMEGWDFNNASVDFNLALKILNEESLKARFEGTNDRLHVLHGLAMIERYQGRPQAALENYRKLTLDIAGEMRELDNRRENDLPNYAEIRALMFGRLVNSLERQADCSLFGENPDFAEAADDYRRAILQCDNLPESQRDSQRIDLLYRRSAALCLYAIQKDGPTTIKTTDNVDIELARQIFAEANALRKTSKQLAGVAELPLKSRLVQALAASCLTVFQEGDTQDSSLILPTELNREPDACDRDELERLMFFHKVLIDNRDLFGLTPYESLKHVAQLQTYCRSACRLESPDPELLAYLRPYYDTVFVAQSKLLPGHTKELIEIAWESTRGTPYMKPGTIQPLLVTYVAYGKCHVVLDVPGGVSRSFILNDIDTSQELIAASANNGMATLPDEVRRAIRDLQIKHPGKKVALRWRDPVLKIGFHSLKEKLKESQIDDVLSPKTGSESDTAIQVTARKPIIEPNGQGQIESPVTTEIPVAEAANPDTKPAVVQIIELKPHDKYLFPFNLQGILERSQIDDNESGLVFKRARNSVLAALGTTANSVAKSK